VGHGCSSEAAGRCLLVAALQGAVRRCLPSVPAFVMLRSSQGNPRAGDLTDNDQLRDEGTADEASGDVQEGFGKARRKVGDALNDVGDKLKR